MPAPARRAAAPAPARRAAPAAAPAARGAARPASRRPTAGAGTASYDARAGRLQAEEEARRQTVRRENAKNRSKQAYRFFLKDGETRQIVVVDDEPSFYRYEHALKNPETGRFDLFLPSLKETGFDPLEGVSERPPYYAMYLTINDLTPYETNDGEEVDFSKKLLVVKPEQQKKFLRLFDKHGSLRGLVLNMTRDGAMSASIGNDIEEDGFMSEEELEALFRTYQDREGKEHEIDGSVAYDYLEMFPEMSEEEICRAAGIEPPRPVGNRRDNARALGGGRERAAAPARSAGRRAPPPADDGYDQPDDADGAYDDADAPAEEPAARPARRGAAQPPARRGAATTRPARRSDPDADADLPDDGGDDGAYDDPDAADPPQRPARRGAAPAARPAARRAPPPPADDDYGDPDAGDPPFDPDPPARAPARRGAGDGPAARRAALRRG